MIQFKKQFSMQNGNKVTKKNWHKVIAISTTPCTGVHGVPAIDAIKRKDGQYFEKWKLVYEESQNKHDGNSGYIFREVNHNGGICGRWPTFKEAIWHAMNFHINVFLDEN